MLTEDEFEAELGSFKPPAAPSGRQRKRVQYDDDYQEEPPSMSLRRPSVAPTRRVSKLIEDDGNVDALVQRSLWTDNVKVTAGPVPFVLQEAAVLLLEQRVVKLSSDTQTELQMAFVQRPTEFYVVDPPVVLCATVDTGTITIKCKEVVPVSVHLLALALEATFSVQVTPKVRTQDEPWAQAVIVKGCRKADGAEGMTPVGAVEAVKRALGRLPSVPHDLDDRVAQYMETIKAVNSADACDPEWLDSHVDGIRAICYGRGARGQQDIRTKLARLRGDVADEPQAQDEDAAGEV